MSDSVTPEAQTPETPESNEPAVTRENLPVLAQAILSAAEGVFSELKAVADEQAKSGNTGQIITDAIKTSEVPEVVAIRKRLEKLNDQLLEAQTKAEELVRPTLDIPSDERLKELDTQYKEKASQMNAYAQVFTNEVMRDDNIPDDAKITLYTYTGELPGRKRGARPGQGAGTFRPRLKSVEYTMDLTGEKGWVKVGDDESSTLTNMATVIKSETKVPTAASDLYPAWVSANGLPETGDWNELNTVTDFVYSVTDEKQKTHQYKIRVTKQTS